MAQHDRRRYQRGSTMFEVMLSLMIFMGMTMMFAAAIPTTTRAARFTANYNQAQSLVRHKLSQFQDIGFSKLNAPALGQDGLRVVDGRPWHPLNNANGDQLATFEFTETDQLWRYFPGGTNSDGSQNTTGPHRPRGYIFLAPFTPSLILGSGSASYSVVQITVVLQWWGQGGQMHSYGATMLLSKTDVL